MSTGEFELGPMDVTEDSIPSLPALKDADVAIMAKLAPASADLSSPSADKTLRIPTLATLPSNAPAADAATATLRRLDDDEKQLATTITSPDVAQEAAKPKPATPEFDPLRHHRPAGSAPQRSAQGSHAHRRRRGSRLSWPRRARRPDSCAPS